MKATARCLRAGIIAAALLLHGLAATAADKELLDILLENGVLTREQYEELLEKEKLEKEDVLAEEKPEKEDVLAEESSEKEDGRDIEVTLDRKGLRVRTTDGQYKFKLGGRIHADASGHRGSLANEATNGAEIRRARFDMEATFYEDFFWKGEVDFADNDVSVKDFFLGYMGFDWGTILAGQQKQPFSLAVEMSSNDIPFVERGTDTDLIIPFIDRAIGVRTDLHGDHWHLATGFYGQSTGNNNDKEGTWGHSSRLSWAPIREEDRVLHLGVRGAYRDPPDNEVRIRSETTHASNLFTVDTGLLRGVQDTFMTGPEAALAVGPFSIGGEYNHLFLRRRDGENVDFRSWHVEAAWSLTGESRAPTYTMKTGEFKRLVPARNISLRGGGWGAWELAARWAAINLDDRDVNGGRQGVLTAGVNWYLNPVMRMLFHWSKILDKNEANSSAENLDIFQVRAQIAF